MENFMLAMIGTLYINQVFILIPWASVRYIVFIHFLFECHILKYTFLLRLKSKYRGKRKKDTYQKITILVTKYLMLSQRKVMIFPFFKHFSSIRTIGVTLCV